MLPGLFRTLIGLVVAWTVFRFLDRMFGRRRAQSPFQNPARNPGNSEKGGQKSSSTTQAKDDGLGEYVDYEEVDGDD
jgi:hypothetical protein